MFTAARFRIYPTGKQQQLLAVQFGCARWVWNEALAKSRSLYRETGKGLSYHAMAIRLPKLKQENEWLRDGHSQALQQSVQNLARAFENFFAKRGKYPRFKAKRGPQSIRYPQHVRMGGNKIYLPKVGWVKCVVHRAIAGPLKTVTISRNACGQYHAAILTDDGVGMPLVSAKGKAIGIDVGLNHFAVTSDGAKFSNPRFLRKALRNLKRKQQSLSRKKKGSNNRDKARRLVARAHERVACARKDHHHKLSRRIVNENQVVCVENLNVKGMVKNRSMARSVSDVGWSMFIGFLEYKCAREGKAFVKCDRWYPSSKTCNHCQHQVGDMPLDVRSWTCIKCGTYHDRDINAALNIRDEGLRILAGGTPATACGGRVSREAKSSLRRRATTCEAGSLRF